MVPDGSMLYAVVEERANSTVMKLKMSWSTEPASGDAAGTFMWSGDTVEWSIPTIDRPQLNVSVHVPSGVRACVCGVGLLMCWFAIDRLGSCARTRTATGTCTST